MSDKEPLLIVKNIKKRFLVGKREVNVLKGVNLEIDPGDFIIIIGPSGSGKTTLLNTILGLEKPDEGEIIISGKNIYSMDEDKRAYFRREKFGVVYQQSNWIKSLNVIDNVAFPLSISGLSPKTIRRKAKEILYLFNFDKFSKYRPSELSGGEQQKLSVCRALISDPPIILADEPTGNLDSITADDLMYDLRTLNVESKKTMIMVTHNPDYERYATKFVCMEDGVIKSVKVKRKNLLQTEKSIKKTVNISKYSFWMKLWFLLKLSFKNFKKNKMRTLLTSGGVALSIGFIAFLVSLSYGFQNLSTEGIKKMEAFQMLDVDTGKSKIANIDDEAIKKISNIFGVEKVYPSVSVAGDFTFHDKKINGIIYGRDIETLKIERPRIVAGESFSSDTSEEVILNIVLAKKLGMSSPGSIVGQNIEVNTIIRPELLENGGENFKSDNRQYKIVGLVEEGNAPYVYTPLGSLKKMGIVNYSEAKVKTTTPDNIDRIKSLIERMGFKASSIKDTVDQANQFFGIFRMILVVFGIIAIAVSCVGMFNTLTISLIEKTREIGVMKSMGATKKDVRNIFILEALFVGVIGGLSGVALSYLLGEFFNTSIYALARSTGNEPVKIFIFPPNLLIFSVLLSLLISILTGIYPARRASKISALDALRYE
ncbi:MAG: ATP-binding cassette domain-containing protein [bacterium]|nr:ATP-binding cassette domain-containing protein [bacterium]